MIFPPRGDGLLRDSLVLSTPFGRALTPATKASHDRHARALAHPIAPAFWPSLRAQDLLRFDAPTP